MVVSTGITEVIKNFSDLQMRFNLHRAERDRFFCEWIEDLPNLDEQQQSEIKRIKGRYDYHRLDGLLLEGTVNPVVVSPLLELAGFLDPPFAFVRPMAWRWNLTILMR